MVEAARPPQSLGNVPAQTLDKRIDSLKPFVDCINDNCELGLIQACDAAGFNSMSGAAKMVVGNPDNAHYLIFTRGMLELVDQFHRQGDKISLICDDDEETAEICYLHYKAVRRVYHKARTKIISLTFANDRYFPALQAADMISFLSRLQAKWEFYREEYDLRKLFEYLIEDRGAKHATWLKQFADKATTNRLSLALEAVKRERH